MSTLDTLRQKLALRLGFTATGPGSDNQKPLLVSFLQDAQTYLFDQFNMPELFTTDDVPTVAGTATITYPSDMSIKKLKAISIKHNGVWEPLHRGIEYPHDTISETTTSVPCRYDLADKLELWPIPDAIYTVRFEYFKNLGALSADNDNVTLDADVVFDLALANAKAHYRQPDAQNYINIAEGRLRTLRAQEHKGQRYISGKKLEDPAPRPVRV